MRIITVVLAVVLWCGLVNGEEMVGVIDGTNIITDNDLVLKFEQPKEIMRIDPDTIYKEQRPTTHGLLNRMLYLFSSLCLFPRIYLTTLF